ncbi:MAG: hypothetical protein LBB49_06610 [Gracilibacteraceae bacterium]|nr:hypothetical protein [Gracilibacteraceae bacterium]
MNRNRTTRVVCLAAASVVLSGAVVFAAVAGSPYETLKKAMLDTAAYHNVTVEGQITLSVNGVTQKTQKMHYILNGDAFLQSVFDHDGNPDGYRWYAMKGLTIGSSDVDVPGWYSANIWPDEYIASRNNAAFSSPFMGGVLNNFPFMIDLGDRDSAAMSFVALSIDVLAGDLKNNVVMSAGQDVRRIRGRLNESQVPELFKAGLDLVLDQRIGNPVTMIHEVSFDGREHVYEHTRLENGTKTITTYQEIVRPITPEEETAWKKGSYTDITFIHGVPYIMEMPPHSVSVHVVPATRDDYEGFDLLNYPKKSLTVNAIYGEAEIDADGNLLTMDAGVVLTIADIFGGTNVLEVKFVVSFSDIGTSNPVCPIPGAEQLFADTLKTYNDDYEYRTFYFTLNQDGSIDADSVTDTYPKLSSHENDAKPS